MEWAMWPLWSERYQKQTFKKFHPPIYGWEGVCLSVCCLSFGKSWITFDGMYGSCWNFQDQSKPLQVIFGWGCQIASLKGTALGLKGPVSRKYISSLKFCLTVVCHTVLETLGPGLKSLGSLILNFRVGPKILGLEWVGTHPKNFFWNVQFSHKIDPPTIQF